MAITGILRKSDSKGGYVNGNVVGIVADFLDEAEKLRVLAIV